jgi:hypothetical protein
MHPDSRDYDRNYNQKEPGNGNTRSPLVWEPLKTFQDGKVVVLIARAETEKGNRYSFRVGKSGKEPEKLLAWLGPQDISVARGLLEEADKFLNLMEKAETFTGESTHD